METVMSNTMERKAEGEARTYAYPVREGFVVLNGKETIVWFDYLWNTDEVTRSWRIEPGTICPSEIRTRDIPNGRASQ